MLSGSSEDDINWRRIEPTTRHKVGWREVVTKTFIMPNGQKTSFDTFGSEGQRHVCVIALDDNNRVIIARQFRVGPERVMLELPGGTVENKETPAATIERELLEETGYAIGKLDFLGKFLKDGYMNAVWYAYLSRSCRLIRPQLLDQEEHIKVELISIKKLIENAKKGRMTDASAVLMAYDKLVALTK